MELDTTLAFMIEGELLSGKGAQIYLAYIPDKRDWQYNYYFTGRGFSRKSDDALRFPEADSCLLKQAYNAYMDTIRGFVVPPNTETFSNYSYDSSFYGGESSSDPLGSNITTTVSDSTLFYGLVYKNNQYAPKPRRKRGYRYLYDKRIPQFFMGDPPDPSRTLRIGRDSLHGVYLDTIQPSVFYQIGYQDTGYFKFGYGNTNYLVLDSAGKIIIYGDTMTVIKNLVNQLYKKNQIYKKIQ